MTEQTTQLRIGTGKELPLQASKWLDLQLLVDADEMKALLSSLDAFKIYRVGAVCGLNEGEIPVQTFIEQYRRYIECLKQGIVPEEKEYRPIFSSIFTLADDHVFQILVGADRRILRVEKPVLQLQVNQIAYSAADGKFRGMVFGKENILWGIHFSFPQLFQDAVTKDVFSVINDSRFPNAALYRQLQLWTRQNTLPTPFNVKGQRVNVPMRLGKACFSWINSHPHLVGSEICVKL